MNIKKILMNRQLHFAALSVLAIALTHCSSDSKNAGSSSSAANSSAQVSSEIPIDESTNDTGEKSAEKTEQAASPVVSAQEAPRIKDPKYQALSQAARSHSENIVNEAAKILAQDANDPVALNALALYHMRKGHLGAAKLLLNRALEKNTTLAALYNNLALVELAQGDQGAAISEFRKALHVNISHHAAMANLGSIYARGGDCGRAVPLLEQVYEPGKSPIPLALDYAVCLRADNSFDKSKSVYDDIIKRDPSNVAAHLDEAILLIEFMNKPKDGLALVNRLKFLETDRRDVLARANALEKKAKLEIK